MFSFEFIFILNFAPLNVILSFLQMNELLEMLNFHRHSKKKSHVWVPGIPYFLVASRQWEKH